MLLALWVVGLQQRLTGCWLFSREKQEVGGQLKELKDQLEAEQYFTVILANNSPCFCAPSLQNIKVKYAECSTDNKTANLKRFKM